MLGESLLGRVHDSHQAELGPRHGGQRQADPQRAAGALRRIHRFLQRRGVVVDTVADGAVIAGVELLAGGAGGGRGAILFTSGVCPEKAIAIVNCKIMEIYS